MILPFMRLPSRKPPPTMSTAAHMFQPHSQDLKSVAEELVGKGRRLDSDKDVRFRGFKV